MMDGGVSDVVGLLADGVADGGYSLAQVDVDHVMQFLWSIEVIQILQLALLVVIAGLIFGLALTKRWQV